MPTGTPKSTREALRGMSTREGKSSATSPFDDLLKQSRESFETLAGSPGPASGSSRKNSFYSQPPSKELSQSPEPSNVRQFLDDRYGDRWRHEILERKQERDQIIVLCKLTIEDEGISKNQFGEATIERDSGGVAQRAGKVNGIPFSFGPSEADDGDGEAAAFQRATESALAKCAESL